MSNDIIGTADLFIQMERKAESAALNYALSEFGDFYRDNHDATVDNITLWEHSVMYLESLDLKLHFRHALNNAIEVRRKHAEEAIASHFLSVGYPPGATKISTKVLHDSMEQAFILKYVEEFDYYTTDRLDVDAIEIVDKSIG